MSRLGFFRWGIIATLSVMSLKTNKPLRRAVQLGGRIFARPWVNTAANVAIILGIFAIGVGVGNGNIHLSSSSNLNKNLPANLDYSSVNDVYKSLKDNYDGNLTQTQVLDGLKQGLAESTGDPHTEYFNAKQAQSFENQLNNSFSGIGAELSQDSDKNLTVVSPIAGFPAAKAGLKPKDVIVTINGASTSGMSLDEGISKIRGPKGTKVTLGVVRDSTTNLNFVITRDDIKLPSVTTKTLDDNIGYIRISTFAEDTGGLSRQAAQQFKAAGVKGIVLDLRGNPGGLVDAAVDVSSLWLPEGKTILQEKQGGTLLQTYTATGNDILSGIPTIVLIDGGSASASEITSGALHDNKAATLLGSKSYGKGSVQQVIDFKDGSELKVTIARWYRPNGQNIDKKGITPDTLVDEPADATADNDPQLQAAQAKLNPQ